LKEKKVEKPVHYMYCCFADKIQNEERLFHMYIISYMSTLENQKNYEIEIEAPEEHGAFFRGGGERAGALLPH
jgi:hypothetical protein